MSGVAGAVAAGSSSQSSARDGGAGGARRRGGEGTGGRTDGFGYASPRLGWICRRHLLPGMVGNLVEKRGDPVGAPLGTTFGETEPRCKFLFSPSFSPSAGQ